MAADDDLWLSQRTISELLRTTPQNVVLHLRDMSKTDANPVQRSIRLASIEGTRRIVRSIKHFNLAEHSALLRIAADRGVAVPEVRVSPVKERRFSELVLGIFADVTEVETQRRVGAYRIDFVLPEIDLAIEYDEDHHDSPARRRADQARQAAIETTTRLRFLRVKQGDEIRGINAILLRLLSVRDREAHRSQ
jgi:very-short-patch-repair endonuclease